MRFKIGDICVPNGNGSCGNYKGKGAFVVITKIEGECLYYDILDKCRNKTGECFSCFHEGDLMIESEKVINKTKNIMTTIIDKIKLAVKSEPKKTLITRGLLDANDTLTTEGRALLDLILVDKYAEDMKKAVDAVPEETK